MKMQSRILWMILAVCLLLCACGADGASETEAQAVTEVTAAPTEAPAETEAPQEEAAVLPAAVLPTEDAATGTLKFYIKDKEFYAGAPVADLLAVGVHTYADLDALVQPGQITGNTRVRVDIEGASEDEEPVVFFNAINITDEPCPLSECLIYSITINCEDGISFGSGNEKEPFVTGQTTEEEIVAAYGEPDYSKSGKTKYKEIAYYQPFNAAYFSFKNGVVRQIMTYYALNVYGDLAENTDLELEGYFGNDAYILMDQYLDVEPYLTSEEDAETETQQTYCPDLEEFITLGGMKIELGCACQDMPEQFSAPFENIRLILSRNHYYRTGIGNEEEFYLLNENGMPGERAKYTTVMGVITQNREYTNWGFDYSGFFALEYQGLNTESTIEDVLEIFGAPQEMLCTSSAKACFVWLHYEDANGNTLRISVDPMTDEIIELKVTKFYKDANGY